MKTLKSDFDPDFGRISWEVPKVNEQALLSGPPVKKEAILSILAEFRHLLALILSLDEKGEELFQLAKGLKELGDSRLKKAPDILREEPKEVGH